jgi:hypothetical protein
MCTEGPTEAAESRARAADEAPAPDTAEIARLKQQISEQQQAYGLLYSRNVTLYSELHAANETIERLERARAQSFCAELE